MVSKVSKWLVAHLKMVIKGFCWRYNPLTNDQNTSIASDFCVEIANPESTNPSRSVFIHICLTSFFKKARWKLLGKKNMRNARWFKPWRFYALVALVGGHEQPLKDWKKGSLHHPKQVTKNCQGFYMNFTFKNTQEAPLKTAWGEESQQTTRFDAVYYSLFSSSTNRTCSGSY